MAQGSVFKRCRHGGRMVTTGVPGRPACRQQHGTWWWRIDAPPDPVTGARRQPHGSGYRTREEAEDQLKQYRARLRSGQVGYDRGLTVKDWLIRWLAEGSSRWEPTTLRHYTTDVHDVLIPALGHLRLEGLARSHVASLLAYLAKPEPGATRTGKRGGSAVEQRSASTVDRPRRTLRSALSAAVEDELIAVNVAAGRFRRSGRRARAREVAWWQPDDLQHFLASVAGDPDVSLWTVVAFTGLRRSEVCGLRWEDVDLTSAQPGITIRWKVVELPGPQDCLVCGRTHRGRQLRPGAKSRAGTYRWVPLTSESVSELLAHQLRQQARRDELGDHWSAHDLVWPCDSPTDREDPGAPRRLDSVTKRHAALVAAAGLPRIVLHEMRHSAISLLAAAGLSVELIALIVGHASDDVTRAVYLHAMKSHLSERAQAAADMVRDAQPRRGL